MHNVTHTHTSRSCHIKLNPLRLKLPKTSEELGVWDVFQIQSNCNSASFDPLWIFVLLFFPLSKEWTLIDKLLLFHWWHVIQKCCESPLRGAFLPSLASIKPWIYLFSGCGCQGELNVWCQLGTIQAARCHGAWKDSKLRSNLCCTQLKFDLNLVNFIPDHKKRPQSKIETNTKTLQPLQISTFNSDTKAKTGKIQFWCKGSKSF